MQLLLQPVRLAAGGPRRHRGGADGSGAGRPGREPGHGAAQRGAASWSQLPPSRPAALPGAVQAGDAVAGRRHALLGGLQDLLTQAGPEALLAGEARGVQTLPRGGAGPGQEPQPDRQVVHLGSPQVHSVLQAAEGGCVRRAGEHRPGGRSQVEEVPGAQQDPEGPPQGGADRVHRL